MLTQPHLLKGRKLGTQLHHKEISRSLNRTATCRGHVIRYNYILLSALFGRENTIRHEEIL